MGRGRFCYVCGKTSDDLFEGLCSACYFKEHGSVRLPKKLVVSFCRGCGNYNLGGWRGLKEPDGALTEVARALVEQNIEHDLERESLDVAVLGLTEEEKKISVDLEVNVKLKSSGESYLVKLNSILELRRILCPSCSKRAGGYYEATIQLRSNKLDSIFNETLSLLSSLYEKDSMAFVVEDLRVSGGIDLKIGSAKAAKTLARHFKRRHNAEIKESATLVGRKEGKDIYRKTILIRL